MTLAHTEDKELLEKFKKPGSRNEAFNAIVRKYQEKIYWHIRRMVENHDDANDVTQDVFIKIWNNLEKFREAAQLYTWMYRIATNESLTFLKKKKRRQSYAMDDEESGIAATLKADVYFDGDEIQIKLQSAINSLPDKQKLVFNMRYYDELTYEQMSKVLGTSVGALKASYHHAVKKIEVFVKGD